VLDEITNNRTTSLVTFLEKNSLIDSRGKYWTSKWNSFETCGDKASNSEPSLEATLFALRAYVNTKTKGAREIANYVLSRAFGEKYGSEIDFLIARSLDEFAHYSTTLYRERQFLD